jgi:hypothetical protein
LIPLALAGGLGLVRLQSDAQTEGASEKQAEHGGTSCFHIGLFSMVNMINFFWLN